MLYCIYKILLIQNFLLPEQTYFVLQDTIVYFLCGAGDYVTAFQ